MAGRWGEPTSRSRSRRFVQSDANECYSRPADSFATCSLMSGFVQASGSSANRAAIDAMNEFNSTVPTANTAVKVPKPGWSAAGCAVSIPACCLACSVASVFFIVQEKLAKFGRGGRIVDLVMVGGTGCGGLSGCGKLRPTTLPGEPPAPHATVNTHTHARTRTHTLTLPLPICRCSQQ